MRGSYEIVHHCDMAVNVEKGIAISTKNRFKDKGMSMEVFKVEQVNPKGSNCLIIANVIYQ